MLLFVLSHSFMPVRFACIHERKYYSLRNTSVHKKRWCVKAANGTSGGVGVQENRRLSAFVWSWQNLFQRARWLVRCWWTGNIPFMQNNMWTSITAKNLFSLAITFVIIYKGMYNVKNNINGQHSWHDILKSMKQKGWMKRRKMVVVMP